MPHRMQTMKGFTLLEVLLSLALISLIIGMGAPLYQSFQVRNDLHVSVVTLANALRRAETLARGGDGDTSWGVHIESGAITVFRGASFSVRDAAYDETFTVPTSISPSGMLEFVFSRFTGFPSASGTTTLTSSIGETRTVTVNTKGMVE